MELPKPLEFPSIYREFVKMFPDDPACVAYLERLRWPNGFVCSACNQPSEPWRHTRGRLVCPTCRHQCTVAGSSSDCFFVEALVVGNASRSVFGGTSPILFGRIHVSVQSPYFIESGTIVSSPVGTSRGDIARYGK